MSELLVLPLEYWMESDDLFDDLFDRLEQINPIFNRPGYYYKRKENICWFENSEGKAFKYNIEEFKYTISLYDVEKYNNKQYNALKLIIEQKLATKEQKRLFYLITEVFNLKQIEYSSKKAFLIKN